MPIAFKPDKFNVQVVHRWTSNSGRWIVFLGTHFNGRFQCWDCGFFQTTSGAVQRLHVKTKEEAMILYDQAKEELGKFKPHEEPADKFHIFGPNGRRTN